MNKIIMLTLILSGSYAHARVPYSGSTRVSVFLGVGPLNSLSSKQSPNAVEVELDRGPVGGFMVQQKLEDNRVLMFAPMTNGTFIFGIGKDY